MAARTSPTSVRRLFLLLLQIIQLLLRCLHGLKQLIRRGWLFLPTASTDTRGKAAGKAPGKRSRAEPGAVRRTGDLDRIAVTVLSSPLAAAEEAVAA